jgi:hypothetical protein
MRCDERDTVSGPEIAERVVAGDQLTAIRRNRAERGLDLRVQRIQPAQVGSRIGLEDGFASRVGGNQRIANIGDVDFRVGDRLPGMWVDLAAQPQRRDAGARNDDFGTLAGRAHETFGRAFESKSIEDDQLGVGDLLGIGR